MWFARSAPEVLALPQTVFADHDEAGNVLVFGVEHEGVIRGVERALARLGVPTSAYRIEVSEPIVFMSTLQDKHRPTLGGIQIHFSMFLCSLSFNGQPLDSGTDDYSFFTASHCTDQQGGTEGTIYYQPTSPDQIGVEAEDPEYFRGGECPRGRKCRYSDSARVLYDDGIAGNAKIAKTSGANNESIDVSGAFDVVSQEDDSPNFSIGEILNKVGRTTGWTAGDVSRTCVDTNVLGSNITLLCQTFVEAAVAGGDSGAPVFRLSGGNAELVGSLWGGSSSGDLFVFSPLKNIVDELGPVDATVDGTGSGTGDGGGGGDDDDGGGGGICPPGNPNHPNCQ